MARSSSAIAAAFAVLVAGTGTLAAETAPRPTAPRTDVMSVGPVTALMDAWEVYKARHLSGDGRIVDDANGMISHSEGQGYGMLIAAKLGDRAAFDRIWAWTKANLGVRGDRLFAWRWDPNADPHTSDLNNATDGDVLLVWALVEAANLWEEPAYLDAATAIAADIARKTIADSSFGPVFLPGAQGFSGAEQDDGPVVNLSYWIFPARAALETAAPHTAWGAVFDNGKAILAKARTGVLGLPSEWTALGGDTPVPAAEFEPVFGYNAIRIPLYLAWEDADNRELLAGFRGLAGHDGSVAPVVIEVATGAAKEELDAEGYRSIALLVECALAPGRMPIPLTTGPQQYYPATLTLLSSIAQLEQHSSCL